MKLNERLLEFTEWYTHTKGISRKELSNRLSVSASQLSSILTGRDKAGLLIIEKFLNICPSLNANWLLSGEGSMIKEMAISQQMSHEDDTRPRIPMNAAAGSVSVAMTGVKIEDCERIPVIKAFSRYDFTLFVKGDSMEPEFHAGDEIACLFIKNTGFIQWGKYHVLDTAQGVVVKKIYDHEEFILCRSEESELYPDFRILKEDVYNISLVIGMLRRY